MLREPVGRCNERIIAEPKAEYDIPDRVDSRAENS